jgi:hypothetical protein
MEDSFLVFIGFLVVLSAVSYLLDQGHLHERATNMERMAERLQLSFEPWARNSLMDQVKRFQFCSEGHSHKMRNVMVGQYNGYQVTVFDWHYQTSSGKTTKQYRRTVAVLASKALRLRSFVLRPAELWHRVDQFFGGQKIEWEEFPRFNVNYTLRSSNERMMPGLFSADVLRYFEGHPGLWVESDGRHLLFCHPDEWPLTDQIPSLLDEACECGALFLKAPSDAKRERPRRSPIMAEG